MSLRGWLAPGAAVITLALAGCGSSSSSSGSSTSASGSASQASGTSQQTKMPAEKVGILNVAAADPGAAQLQSAAQQAAAKLGWTTVAVDAGGNPSKMAAGMQQLVAQNVNAILLDAVDPAAVATGLRQAVSAHIPVILYGGAGTTAPGVTQIVPNDTTMATLVSNAMFKSLGGHGNVAVMTTDGVPWSHIRSQLFEKLAKQHPGIHVVAIHQVDFANFTSDLLGATKAVLQANPNLNAILATISPYPTPIAAALGQAGAAHKVKVFGFYDYPSELQLIKGGMLTAVATTSFPHNALQAMNALAQYFGQKTPITATGANTLPLKYQVVTNANAPASINDDPEAAQAQTYYMQLWRREFSNVR